MNIPLFVQWLEDDVVVVNVLHPNFNLLNRRGAAPLKVFNAKTREKEEPSFFGKILSISKSLSFFSCSPIWKAPLTLPLGIKDDIESTIFWQQFYDLDIKGRTLLLLPRSASSKYIRLVGMLDTSRVHFHSWWQSGCFRFIGRKFR